MTTQVAYSFSNVSIIYNGIALEGFYTGDDLVTFTANQPLVTTTVGADGSGTFNVSGDRSATMTLKLLASSPSNNILAADWQLISSGNSLLSNALRLVYVRDTNGTALATGIFAIESFPADFRFGEKDSGRTWTLKTANLFIFPGTAGGIVNTI